jgi:hypothetical protein
MQVFLDQSECLFFHFFAKLTQSEPVYGQIIVIVAALNVCNIKKFTSELTDVLEYLREEMGSHYAPRLNMNSIGQQMMSFS